MAPVSRDHVTHAYVEAEGTVKDLELAIAAEEDQLGIRHVDGSHVADVSITTTTLQDGTVRYTAVLKVLTPPESRKGGLAMGVLR